MGKKKSLNWRQLIGEEFRVEQADRLTTEFMVLNVILEV